MSRKLMLGAIVSTMAIGAIVFVPMAVGAESAQIQLHNGQGYGMGLGNGSETRAQALDMTSDQLKEQLQTKTMLEVITDKGMTLEQYHGKVQTAAQDRWQDMGLSQEEIESRTKEQIERQADCDGTGVNQSQGGRRNGQSR